METTDLTLADVMNSVNALTDTINVLKAMVVDTNATVKKLVDNQNDIDSKLVGNAKMTEKAIEAMRTIVFHNKLIEKYGDMGKIINENASNAVKPSGEPKPIVKSEMPTVANDQEVKVIDTPKDESCIDRDRYIDHNDEGAAVDERIIVSQQESNSNDPFREYFIESMLHKKPVILSNKGTKFSISEFIPAINIVVASPLTREFCSNTYDEIIRRCDNGEDVCSRLMKKIRDSFDENNK